MAMNRIYYTVAGEVIAEKRPGQDRRDYVTDILGTTAGVASSNGSSVERYEYSPYGRRTYTAGAAWFPRLGWCGSHGYYQTGRVGADLFVRARHLDTLSNRWSSVDPLWPREHAYQYVNGNPISHVDPTGQTPQCIAFVACAGVALAAVTYACFGKPFFCCLKDWLRKRPVVATAVITTCGALGVACLGPAFVASLRTLATLAGTGAAAAASANAGRPYSDCCTEYYMMCQAACSAAHWRNKYGPGWPGCCENYCSENYKYCERRRDTPRSWECYCGKIKTRNPFRWPI